MSADPFDTYEVAGIERMLSFFSQPPALPREARRAGPLYWTALDAAAAPLGMQLSAAVAGWPASPSCPVSPFWVLTSTECWIALAAEP